MADKTWQNRVYGTLDKGGLERAIDFTQTEDYFAPVRAVILYNSGEVEMGVNANPISVTGDVSITDKVCTNLWGVVAISGDNTIVPAPGTENRIVVPSFMFQNESATPTLMILHSGTTTNGWRWLGQAQGDGVSKDLPDEAPWKLNENEGLTFTLLGANQCGYSIEYYTEEV